MYAAGVVSHLKARYPAGEFYGCAGPRLRAEGVTPVIDSARLAVVGLAEVVIHLPRIYGEYRKLIHFAERHRTRAALLTDSPDFHLRVARHLKRMDVPVFYLVAPQVWAWRQGRVKTIAQLVDKLFCLFPFEENWFRERGVDATYIGHPLASTVRIQSSRDDFFVRHDLPKDKRMLVLLPGSRSGEARRHLPVLLQTVAELRRNFSLSITLAIPKGFYSRASLANFREPMDALSIKVIENETWDAIGHADVALAASGTVTVEAAILGTPMVTFYKVTPLTWWAGRRLVKVPYLSMVNLIAEREIIPELIQHDMTPQRLAASVSELLKNEKRRWQMKDDLSALRKVLKSEGDPFLQAANVITGSLEEQRQAQETLT
jgi:lipid-A-disaccharide synthase